MSPAARAGIGALRVYQWTLAPVLGGQCRFAPSCSAYAIEALARHGAVRGAGLAAWRVLRCQPWCEGGYDPVPDPVPHPAPPAAPTRQDPDRGGTPARRRRASGSRRVVACQGAERSAAVRDRPRWSRPWRSRPWGSRIEQAGH